MTARQNEALTIQGLIQMQLQANEDRKKESFVFLNKEIRGKETIGKEAHFTLRR